MDLPTPSSAVPKVIRNNLKVLKSADQVFILDDIISCQPLIYDERREMFVRGPAIDNMDENEEEEKISYAHRAKIFKDLKNDIDREFKKNLKKLTKNRINNG